MTVTTARPVNPLRRGVHRPGPDQYRTFAGLAVALGLFGVAGALFAVYSPGTRPLSYLALLPLVAAAVLAWAMEATTAHVHGVTVRGHRIAIGIAGVVAVVSGLAALVLVAVVLSGGAR